MKKHSIQVFEKIKKINNNNQEYWSARELQKTLHYSEYRNFILVVKKAAHSCENSGESSKNHFVELNKMVVLGSTTSREIKDIHLTRYACYLVMQNSDPTKKVVALGQTYFAIQTRR
jgi:DNA-damage-inducible protein D